MLEDVMEILGIVLAIVAILLAIFFYIVPWANVKEYFKPITLDKFASDIQLREQYKVAIIDDDIDSFPVDFIRKMGFQVNTYESISFADSLEIAKYDVVFLDVKGVVEEDLEEGGAKFIKILKQAREYLPIVAVSSGRFQPELNDYFKASDLIINKPIDEYKVSEELTELKSSFFELPLLVAALKELIRKLPVVIKEKNKLEILIVKYFLSKTSKEQTMQCIHQVATVDSEKIITQVNIIKDRLDND